MSTARCSNSSPARNAVWLPTPGRAWIGKWCLPCCRPPTSSSGRVVPAWPNFPSLRLRELRRLAPHAIVVAITPFGLEGPWAHAPSSDLTLQAWAGSVFSRGSPERPPVQIGGRPAEWLGGLFAAVGALTSWQRTVKHGRGRAARRVDSRVDRVDRADVRRDQAVDGSSRCRAGARARTGPGRDDPLDRARQ